MPPKKSQSRLAEATGSTPAPLPASKLPAPLRFPLLVVFSLTLSSLLYTFAADFTAGELASVSRKLDGWGEIFGLIGWRVVELGTGWWFEYDGVDLASLTLLSHLPPLYLLTTFYSVRPATVVVSLAIDLLTTYVPFRLLRPLSPTHNSQAPKSAVPNRPIINDISVQAYTTLLAAAIYGLAFYSAFASWLPVYLVVHFEGIKDISAAHSAVLPFLVASFLPVGYAAREFIFTPAVGARADLGDARSRGFNPATATLLETLKYNVWGGSKGSKVVIQRTTALVLISGFNTWLQSYVTIEGVEAAGAAGWAGIWAAAGLLTGLTFWWVGDV
ncbi:MAG: hypothetical protein M1819_003879 [Sarea resinae]|nr:MAG: hypothetical protein M1819_003879 [Sarea resinae]